MSTTSGRITRAMARKMAANEPAEEKAARARHVAAEQTADEARLTRALPKLEAIMRDDRDAMALNTVAQQLTVFSDNFVPEYQVLPWLFASLSRNLFQLITSSTLYEDYVRVSLAENLRVGVKRNERIAAVLEARQKRFIVEPAEFDPHNILRPPCMAALIVLCLYCGAQGRDDDERCDGCGVLEFERLPLHAKKLPRYGDVQLCASCAHTNYFSTMNKTSALAVRGISAADLWDLPCTYQLFRFYRGYSFNVTASYYLKADIYSIADANIARKAREREERLRAKQERKEREKRERQQAREEAKRKRAAERDAAQQAAKRAKLRAKAAKKQAKTKTTKRTKKNKD